MSSTDVIRQLDLSQLCDVLVTAACRIKMTGSNEERESSLRTIIAAVGRLEATLVPPIAFLQQMALGYQVSMALGTVNDLGLADVIGSGESPMTSEAIGRKVGLPKDRVARLLRLLANHGVFSETSPDVWDHNHISEALRSGLTLGAIAQDPVGRFSKGNPLPAWISHVVEQGGMAAVMMVTAYREDLYRKGCSILQAPFVKAFGKPFWQWLEDERRVLNMTKAFELNNARPSDVASFPWSALPADSTIVDVGGGVGSAMAVVLPLCQPATKVIIQDISQVVIERAQEFWEHHVPSLVDSGHVTIQRHDFFEPQPIVGATVYFLRHVLHDWDDDKCVNILTHLFHAAGECSRLLIVEVVLSYACADFGPLESNAVEGAYPKSAFPKPLPPNGGKAASFEHNFDMHVGPYFSPKTRAVTDQEQMLNVLNGAERTFEEFKQLATKAGWTPHKVYRSEDPSALRILEFCKESSRS
ncbi:hypothetical protein FRC00_003182 [Tulasnella sp. 408]|nr:hypothetical protein FRC00_003182 [Tulasnella sp. 408]